MRCNCGATFEPPWKRGSASDVVAFQRLIVERSRFTPTTR
jgi:hypothetical protein